MSFGFSIGDFVLLTKLAWDTVQNARNACGARDDLVREVKSLHIVLQRVETEVSKPASILNQTHDNRISEVKALAKHCRKVLTVLSSILEKYNALSREERSVTKLWQRVKFGNGEMQDLAKIRSELAAHTQAFNMFLNLLSLGSQGKMEECMDSHGEGLQEIKQSLHWVIASMQARAPGEKSILTTYSEDDKGVWKDLRRQLVKEGCSSRVIKRYMGHIKRYVVELGERGIMDSHIEEAIDEDNVVDVDGIFLVGDEKPSTGPSNPPSATQSSDLGHSGRPPEDNSNDNNNTNSNGDSDDGEGIVKKQKEYIYIPTNTVPPITQLQDSIEESTSGSSIDSNSSAASDEEGNLRTDPKPTIEYSNSHTSKQTTSTPEKAPQLFKPRTEPVDLIIASDQRLQDIEYPPHKGDSSQADINTASGVSHISVDNGGLVHNSDNDYFDYFQLKINGRAMKDYVEVPRVRGDLDDVVQGGDEKSSKHLIETENENSHQPTSNPVPDFTFKAVLEELATDAPSSPKITEKERKNRHHRYSTGSKDKEPHHEDSERREYSHRERRDSEASVKFDLKQEPKVREPVQKGLINEIFGSSSSSLSKSRPKEPKVREPVQKGLINEIFGSSSSSLSKSRPTRGDSGISGTGNLYSKHMRERERGHESKKRHRKKRTPEEEKAHVARKAERRTDREKSKRAAE